MSSTINASTASGGGIVTAADASGILQLQTGGTTAVTIDASQNVGIGTSSPATKLHLVTPSATAVALRAGNSVSYAEFQVDASGNSQLIAPGGAQIFNTSGAERMRIDSSGNLLVGTTTSPGSSGGFLCPNQLFLGGKTSILTGYSSVINMNYSGAVSYGIMMQNIVTTTSNALSFINSSSAAVGSISTSSTATSYNTSSDYRLKENVATMVGALDTVALLNPVTYKWKADGSDGQGFIAHELAEVCSHAVTGEKDAVDADGKPIYQGIDTSFLVATLTAAIQEQQTLIEALTARLTALEALV